MEPSQSDADAEPSGSDLLLSEANHRAANDLQLVISLLSLELRRVESPEARQALRDSIERVTVLARSRQIFSQRRNVPILADALRGVCEALAAQTELGSVMVSAEIAEDGAQLSESQVTALTLAVNELATNAVKHAFHDGDGGHVRIALCREGEDLVICVSDDGVPMPPNPNGGSGLSLAARLVESAGGRLEIPADGSKLLKIRVHVGAFARNAAE